MGVLFYKHRVLCVVSPRASATELVVHVSGRQCLPNPINIVGLVVHKLFAPLTVTGVSQSVSNRACCPRFRQCHPSPINIVGLVVHKLFAPLTVRVSQSICNRACCPRFRHHLAGEAIPAGHQPHVPAAGPGHGQRGSGVRDTCPGGDQRVQRGGASAGLHPDHVQLQRGGGRAGRRPGWQD